jgi:hypothetical protein
LLAASSRCCSRFERTSYKWLTQFLHHTAVGLPAQPMPAGVSVVSPDPAAAVLSVISWMFAQQA